MAEFIEREALLRDIENSVRFTVQNTPSAEMRGAHKIIDRIKCAPYVDVVPVVRCKDCKHWGIREGNDPTKSYYCDIDGMWCKPCRLPHDFCSYGERKEGAE